MKINELFSLAEEDPGVTVPNTLADYFISLKAHGKDKVPTAYAQEEILKHFQQDVSLEELTQMMTDGKLPMVSDINAEEITLDTMDSEIKNKEVDNSEDEVSKMARQASNHETADTKVEI